MIKPIPRIPAPRAYFHGGYEDYPSITADYVITDDNKPQWTGLYDQHGNPLYRIADKHPMGFKCGG